MEDVELTIQNTKLGLGSQPALTGRATAKVAAATQVQPETLAFFAALNDNMAAGNLPHPIRARNAGLVPAWQTWLAWRKGDVSLLPQLFTDLSLRFRACAELADRAIKS